MVASNRIIASSMSQALAGADLTEMHQNAVLIIHNRLKAQGFTVLGSSDSVIADANDNISVIGDVVSNGPGVAHSHIHYQAPAVLGDWELILDVNDPDATPREIDFFAAPTYNLDGTITNRPTAVTPANEWSRTNTDLIPTAVFSACSVHEIWFNDSEFFLGFSLNGSGFIETALWLVHPKGGDDPNLTYPYAFFFHNSTLGALSTTQIGIASNWRSHHSDGSDIASVELATPADFMTSWAGGVSNASGKPPIAPMDFVINSATQGQYKGRSEDFRAVTNNYPVNQVVDGDTDAFRQVSVGGLWLICDRNEIPITL